MKSFDKCLKDAKNELDEEQCGILFKKLSSDFKKLPIDVLLSEVLPELEIADLVSICSTSKKMRNACYDHDKSVFLWLKILKRDFGIKLTKEELEKLKEKEGSYLEVYKNELLVDALLRTDKSLETLNEILDYGVDHDNILIFKIGLERMTKNDISEVLLRPNIVNNLKFIKAVLNAGGDVNIKNWQGDTMLFKATLEGYDDIVKLVLEAGANPDIPDAFGDTALILVSRKGDEVIAELLLGAGADPNIQDAYGDTALTWASRKGYKDIVELLLRAGADPKYDK